MSDQGGEGQPCRESDEQSDVERRARGHRATHIVGGEVPADEREIDAEMICPAGQLVTKAAGRIEVRGDDTDSLECVERVTGDSLERPEEIVGKPAGRCDDANLATRVESCPDLA